MGEVVMTGKKFDLTEETLSVIEEIGGHMPGGFFMYKAADPEELPPQPVRTMASAIESATAPANTGFKYFFIFFLLVSF